jgi:YfiH family protein
MILIPEWPAPANVRAAFTLRTGGVSVAPFDSLNLGIHVGDRTEAVTENRRRVNHRLGLPSEPGWLRQVHGNRVVRLENAAAAAGATAEPEADASVTAGNRVCAVQVADCMPVLFAARDGSVVGAAHAGWRGLAGGVLGSTLRQLNIGASQVIAWMGPAIGAADFEVGDDVRDTFVSAEPTTAAAFVANARGRWQCDLYAIARQQLTALGLAAVSGGGWSTYSEPTRFFSFRRDGQCGRMAALIWRDSGAAARA